MLGSVSKMHNGAKSRYEILPSDLKRRVAIPALIYLTTATPARRIENGTNDEGHCPDRASNSERLISGVTVFGFLLMLDVLSLVSAFKSR